jgi:hypothetical protein
LKAYEEEALECIQVNGEKIVEDDSGILEQRLWHLDRILFGSNTILMFKYPALKRKFEQAKRMIESRTPGMDADQMDSEIRAALIKRGIFSDSEVSQAISESEGGLSEDEVRRNLMIVADYTDMEIDEDINRVDWEFAYNEILKIEERKKDKQSLEAQ